jgi:hypothetical protein
VRDSTIVVAVSARERLRELTREDRDLLIQALYRELSSQNNRAVDVTNGGALMTEVSGYLIVYRPLTDGEKVRFDVRDGYFVISVKPLWPGFSA